jgi:hypothetical protein
MINNQLLEEFMKGFYGFGTYSANYWFIGMEEGGGNTIEAIEKQLYIWEKHQRKELLDVIQFAREMNITDWYGEKPKLQPTWKHLIRIFLTAKGKNYDNEVMREYQKNYWGTETGETCLLELLPLPSPNTSSWIYKDISSIPYLKSRKIYQETVTSSRIKHLQQRIKNYQPKAVIFYGSVYENYWKKIIGINHWEISSNQFNYALKDSTVFVSSKHPVAFGATNEYFNNIGKLVAEFAH